MLTDCENNFSLQLIDTHAHLTDSIYNGAKEIIDSMADDKLKNIITVGYDYESSKGCVDLANNNAKIFAAVGIHPSEAEKATDAQLDELYELTKKEKVVAYGEIGLDYHYENTVKSAQKDILVKQIEIARKSGQPIIFHVRDAYGDFDEIIEPYQDLRAVMHCYSGSKEQAKKYLKKGYYISFSGSVTFKNAVNLHEVAAFAPLDRLLVETDCPYLTPMPFRGQVNYPKYVLHVAEQIARLKNISLNEVAKNSVLNAQKLFNKIK